ncbi:MAG: DUF4128 domain-containing protein [Candidatus Cloacimonetes bacterium]|nr:DUF4128 domain-containing protein [Candidatus Cloacimonadota bacterium]
MINKIYTAFLQKINTVTPKIDSVYENKACNPINDVPFQELYILPSDNTSEYINETTYNMEGLFQISLNYPINQGRTPATDRVNLYMDLFPKNTKLTYDGLLIRQVGIPQIANLGVVGDRYKIVLRVQFLAVI